MKYPYQFSYDHHWPDEERIAPGFMAEPSADKSIKIGNVGDLKTMGTGSS
ncbi:hypothetical protein V1T76_23220 [Roseibium sp. FZY0029]|nr:hypothetical protein [Roseibium sp. FZY0029]